MSQSSFSTDLQRQFSDPYAVLGLSVAADDRRVLKRYRAIAKSLHPDSYVNVDAELRELASQILARIVNPAYQRLKQDKGRAETMALLRFRVRRMNREEVLIGCSEVTQQLLDTPQADLEVFYEQAIANLAEQQYQQLDQFEPITEQLGELNLVYLQLKMGEPLIREKRSGIVSAAEAKPIQFTPIAPDVTPSAVSYAHRHYLRALEYIRKSSWAMAIRELQDAIKIDANRSEYHALMAKAYWMQNLQGAARAYCRQALKLNPNDPVAIEYAQKLKLTIEQPNAVKNAKASNGGLFGLFAKKQ
jgi:tetratricopeptide (TPR) repeat protein